MISMRQCQRQLTRRTFQLEEAARAARVVLEEAAGAARAWVVLEVEAVLERGEQAAREVSLRPSRREHG